MKHLKKEKEKRSVASEALVIEVTEVYKMLHENSTIKFKDSDTWLLQTPQDDIMKLSPHSWLMKFLQKREKSAKPSPPQTHLFQITFGCTANSK